MDILSMWPAVQKIYGCLSNQWLQLTTLASGAAQIIAGASVLFSLGQTQKAGVLNAFLPPVFQKAFKGLGTVLGKIALNVVPK